MSHPPVLSPQETNRLYNLAFGLAVFTIVYNLLEGILATSMGYQDETLALFGFGVDSFIEMISGIGIVVMITRIRNDPKSLRGDKEKMALRLTGYCFYLLVAGLIISSGISIYVGRQPETTFWGVVISIVSIAVMLFLLNSKVRTGKKLHSDAILADASCTKVCIYMSIVLLASSAIYEYTGFPYADALGTIGLAWFSYQEARECFEKAAEHSYTHEHHH